MRVAVVGTGEPRTRVSSPAWPRQIAGRAWFFAGYDEALAHWIEGASDVFLMPSQYEPCGLNQMYSLRYGTIPVVRSTGGLADSVTHFDPATGLGTGIVFNDFDAAAMNWALDTAMQWYAQTRALGTHRAERHALRFLLGNPGQRVPEAVRRTTSA